METGRISVCRNYVVCFHFEALTLTNTFIHIWLGPFMYILISENVMAL